MFGWELPPHNSGGLGVACQGLSSAMSKDHEIIFVLPRRVDINPNNFNVLFANDKLKFIAIDSLLTPYMTTKEYTTIRQTASIYGATLFEEVERYAIRARELAKREEFDIIHAHDWLSFKAGIVAKEVTGKPLIVQVHSTEYDRCGGSNVNPYVYEIEKEGMKKADKIIAVSNFTKKIITDHYGIPDSKVEVIHNRINADEYNEDPSEEIFKLKSEGKKIVLFAGRFTLQKGPDYFLKVAKRVLSFENNVLFVMAGSGDMEHRIINDAAVMGISDNVLFTGFLRGKELSDIYKLADVYVMPSVSEPFGIAALESIANGTPVIISKQSGVSEVVQNAIKVDFWDVDEMTNKIVSILSYPSLHKTLKDNSQREASLFSWDFAARECSDLYKKLLRE